MLLLLMLGQSLLQAAPENTPPRTMPNIGKIAYINESQGRDAIFIRDASQVDVIFTCDFGNEIILTPSVSSDGKFITFLVDNGRNQKTIHILGPLEKVDEKWQANDLLVMMIRGGAWPVVKDHRSVYISMPDQTSLTLSRSSDIYLISPEKIQQITYSTDLISHIWPLVNSNSDKLIYREVPLYDEKGETSQAIRSRIIDLKSGASSEHFVDQSVFLEQWTRAGEILFSLKENDDNGDRIYALYNPATREAREIYRGNSRQGSLSTDSRFLATIRPAYPGSANFDIFVSDLISNTEFNLTQSPKQSESLIAWIE